MNAPGVAFIVADSGSRVVVAEDQAQVDKLIERRAELPDVQQVVVFDGEGDGDWVIALDDLEERGRGLLAESPDAVADRIRGIRPEHFSDVPGEGKVAIPLSVAGWGIREGAAALVWQAAGLEAAEGVAASVSYGVVVRVDNVGGRLLIIDHAAVAGSGALLDLLRQVGFAGAQEVVAGQRRPAQIGFDTAVASAIACRQREVVGVRQG